MTVGELVSANVVDKRVWDAEGERAPGGVYLLGPRGTALPFVMTRAWKVGTGMVTEEVHFYGPSGRLVHRWGPATRRMVGSMDLTVETDTITDAFLDEAGVYLVSFVLDGEIVGEIEIPVHVQSAPAKLPKDVEDGLKRSDVLWIGVQAGDTRKLAPCWFAYRNGRIYVLSQRDPGPQEQTVPGIPGARELIVVTRRKGRETALGGFHASFRVLEGAEWDDAAKALADRRRSRVGSPQESIARWRGTCDIAELTPVVPA